jgi:tetratricopeptide (TPR) repeat protein
VLDDDPIAVRVLQPSVPAALETICHACLHKLPQKRYPSAAALAEDLARWLAGRPIQARPASSLGRVHRMIARRPAQAALLLCLLLVMALTTGFALVLRERAAQEREKQAREREEQRRQLLQALQALVEVALDSELDEPEKMDGVYRKMLRTCERLEDDPLMRASFLADLFSRYGTRVLETRRDPKLAREILAKAAALARKGLIPGAGEADERFALAKILDALGDACYDCGEVAEAQSHYESALQQLDGLPGPMSGSREVKRVKAEVLHDLGLVRIGQPAKRADARKFYEQALVLRREVAASRGARDRRDLARTLGYLGDLDLSEGLLEQAAARYEESHQIRKKLDEENHLDFDTRFQLARSYRNLSDLCARKRKFDEALDHLGRCLEILEDLLARRKHLFIDADLPDALNRKAELLLLVPDGETLREAGELLERSERTSRDALGLTKQWLYVKYSLAENLAIQARRLLLTGHRYQAREVAGEARAAFRKAAGLGPLPVGAAYHAAAADAMAAELEGSATARSGLIESAWGHLDSAVAGGYANLTPEDVLRDRAFQSVKDDPWFPASLEKWHESQRRPHATKPGR